MGAVRALLALAALIAPVQSQSQPFAKIEVDEQSEIAALTFAGTGPSSLLEESASFQEWIPCTSALFPFGEKATLRIPLQGPRRFYRVVPAPPPAAPSPLSTNDIFYPYLNQVPAILTNFPDLLMEGLQLRRFRFAGIEGTHTGETAANEIYCVLARPLNLASNAPAILILHGGNGQAEEAKAIAWARRGFIALAPELVGHAAVGTIQSITRVTQKPYLTDFFIGSPNARASTAFDSLMAGLLAFNLLAAQPGVDTNNVSISGASMGGWVATAISGLLDVRVNRTFSLFGCGFFFEDTLFKGSLAAIPKIDRQEWIANLDAGSRIERVRARFLMYAAANDIFFRPPSVMKTFSSIRADKYVLFSPQDDHVITMPGGTASFDGTSWTVVEKAFFQSDASQFNPLFPRFLEPVIEGANTIRVRVAALPSNYTAWAYYSDAAAPFWQKRGWEKLNVQKNNGTFHVQFPEGLPTVDWFFGLTFNYPNKQGPEISLSTPMQHKAL